MHPPFALFCYYCPLRLLLSIKTVIVKEKPKHNPIIKKKTELKNKGRFKNKVNHPSKKEKQLKNKKDNYAALSIECEMIGLLLF